MTANESAFQRLRAAAGGGPVVVAHRGHSAAFAENTLPAFEAARALGCAMQEFDVRATRDGHLVCIHDASLDRTTDAGVRLGPGALVAETTLAAIRQLDAGSWHPGGHGPAVVPTLAEALAAMLPDSIPMIEHKAGSAETFVAELQRSGQLTRCILQSFDWRFVAAAHRLAPDLPVAVLGPTLGIERPDARALELARRCGAQMIHWRDRDLGAEDVERAHADGLLVCSYTTDDELGLRGGAAIGIDAMCTNVPDRMLALAAMTGRQSGTAPEEDQ